MSIMDAMDVIASGMSAQRVRMAVTSSNLANANTTRTEEGGPYRRRDPIFSATAVGDANDFTGLLNEELQAVKVDGVRVSTGPLEKVFDPHHPDADGDGYVSLPDVNVVEEMVNMVTASRSYEANATAFDLLRSMMQRALEIGR